MLQRMVTDDVHVAEDGHICCVMTIMQDDVHVQRMVKDAV